MSAREMLWIICNHFSVRGKLTIQYMISDLLSLRMPDNKDNTFHRWFNAWSEQYHRLPDDQKQANMAVLVEQVVDNARQVLKFNNMIENFDIWRQDNPHNTDPEAMDWLRRRFTQLTDQ